jgi:hypothetical protein
MSLQRWLRVTLGRGATRRSGSNRDKRETGGRQGDPAERETDDEPLPRAPTNVGEAPLGHAAGGG